MRDFRPILRKPSEGFMTGSAGFVMNRPRRATRTRPVAARSNSKASKGKASKGKHMIRQKRPKMAIVADIGGTNARFAVANLASLELSQQRNFFCAEHASLAGAAAAFIAGLGAAAPRHAALAVAAPVSSETVSLTNSPWSFETTAFRREAHLESLLILNDFEALALSLPYLEADDLEQIGGTAPVERGTKVVLGPGTGLGAAGLVWSPSGWIAVPGEGGHVTLASPEADQFALIERLLEGRDHVSAERVISGPGLCDLYRAVAKHRGQQPLRLEPGEIVDRAVAGNDPVAQEALSHFIIWLGRFAGDAALFFGARGGVYLGGGIPLRLFSLLRQGGLRRAFEAKGRMRSFLAPIPLYVITDETAALKGAAAGLREALETGGSGRVYV
jgi:glucokinase